MVDNQIIKNYEEAILCKDEAINIYKRIISNLEKERNSSRLKMKKFLLKRKKEEESKAENYIQEYDGPEEADKCFAKIDIIDEILEFINAAK